ncbi:MAG TPA: ABC transporter substrate-binding protein [Erysipelothrix sp.]|nr:ABC transporter substrate-binding protein [Erysipelothrix sp.]
MKKSMKCIILLVAVLVLGGCGQKPSPSQVLKVGVMPAVDSLPIFVADQMGIFEDLGLDIEVEVYTNAMDRQSALQAGGLDGAMTDVIGLVNNVHNGFDIKVTTSTDGVFPILYNSKNTSKETLVAGMMEVSVTNYLSDEFLKDVTFTKEYITDLPARLEMISKGSLDLAVIPEPMASMGALNGLDKYVMELNDAYSPEVMVFNQKAIDSKNKELKLFHQGYNLALETIEKDPSAARQLLVDTLALNPAILDDFVLPTYNKVRVPSQEYIQKIIDWNNQVLGTDIELDYSKLVDGQFVK